MVNLSKALKVVLVVAVVLAALLFGFIALVMGSLDRSAEESFQSSYGYELKISTSGPIEHAVLLLPLPSRYDPDSGTNVTPVNLSRSSFSNFDRDNISMRIEDVGGIPMLNISADRLDPVYKNHIEPIAIMPGQNESELPEPTHIYSDRYSEETPLLVDMELSMLDTDPGHEIETRTPAGPEPLFEPYRIVDNVSRSDDEYYYLGPGASGYIIEVPVTLSFDAADGNALTITSEFHGRNEWWVLGWQYNTYFERISHEFRGPCNGTYPVRGVLVTGEGVY
jgi:hypothetical protein